MKYLLEKPIRGTIGPEGFKAAIRWRHGVLITDEPEKLAGKDLGPDPYTLLLASLVSCTLATLRMYINHKGLAVPEIAIEANMYHRIVKEGTVMRIERRIIMENMEDREVQQRLIEVAENCPVSKILKGDVSVITEFIQEGVNG